MRSAPVVGPFGGGPDTAAMMQDGHFYGFNKICFVKGTLDKTWTLQGIFGCIIICLFVLLSLSPENHLIISSSHRLCYNVSETMGISGRGAKKLRNVRCGSQSKARQYNMEYFFFFILYAFDHLLAFPAFSPWLLGSRNMCIPADTGCPGKP